MPWFTALKVLIPLLLGAALYGSGYYHGNRSATAALDARWTARDLAEAKAAATANQAHAAAVAAAQALNDTIEAKLHDTAKERDAALRDADLVRRLLTRAAGAASVGGAVPKATDQPGTAAAPGAAGDGPLAGLLADAAGECRRNADRFAALQAEIEGQL